MDVTLIAAVADDGCIGRGNALPWRLPGDLKRFRALTLGKPVLMGRRTWESLPKRPLDGRLNIVLSRAARGLDGALVASHLGTALDQARKSGAAETMVIGGAEIYALALPFATRLQLTRVATMVPGGDAFFPALDPALWAVVAEEAVAAFGDAPAHTYQTLELR